MTPPQRRDREFIPVITWRGSPSAWCRRPQRRDREFIPVIVLEVDLEKLVVRTSTKGPGVYPGHLHRNGHGVLAVQTSTKGPGVYPGHNLVDLFIACALVTSTKGPGVYPGHREPCANASSMIYLNEGTGSLSRSYLLEIAKIARNVYTSTKGPGVYPGHSLTSRVSIPFSTPPQRRDREFIPVIR